MLVVNNGAPKSGTTWVQKMLARILVYKPPAKRWRRTDWYTPSIRPDDLQSFLSKTDFASQTYLFKAHFKPELAPVLIRKNVVVISCARSIPDMVLSFYHHQKRLGKTDLSLNDWVSQHGLEVARNRIDYLEGWAPYCPTMHFEMMYSDPAGSALRLAQIVNSPLSEEAIREVGRSTQNTPDKGVREGHHVRTGKPGASREELDPAMFEALQVFDAELLRLFPEREAIAPRF